MRLSLEKDIWVVATLDMLFLAPFAEYLIFKVDTSLSKVWRAIHLFSKDVDITYDIRAFSPNLIVAAGLGALPSHLMRSSCCQGFDPRRTDS